MIDWLRRLLGLLDALPDSGPSAPSAGPDPASRKPALPEAELQGFIRWYGQQRKPAVALNPDPSAPVGAAGSRLGGPAFLLDGESWPTDEGGVPLEFLAQLDMADCATLAGYPREGVVQFFIGRDDLFGANFDDCFAGKRLVRHVPTQAGGSLHQQPPLAELGGVPFSDFSPFMHPAERERGVALVAEEIEDRIEMSNNEAYERYYDLFQRYNTRQLDDFLENEGLAWPPRHNTGGYPAFTQTDIRTQPQYADLNHTLLRLTSDDQLMWGDVGECVFMMRSADLARGDFSRVAYSWDCT